MQQPHVASFPCWEAYVAPAAFCDAGGYQSVRLQLCRCDVEKGLPRPPFDPTRSSSEQGRDTRSCGPANGHHSSSLLMGVKLSSSMNSSPFFFRMTPVNIPSFCAKVRKAGKFSIFSTRTSLSSRQATRTPVTSNRSFHCAGRTIPRMVAFRLCSGVDDRFMLTRGILRETSKHKWCQRCNSLNLLEGRWMVLKRIGTNSSCHNRMRLFSLAEVAFSVVAREDLCRKKPNYSSELQINANL